ncbi:MAG: alkaline phosphatase family protein [Pirellulales bacterium]
MFERKMQVRLFNALVPLCSFAAVIVCGVARGAPPAFDHIVIVIEENHSYSQVIGNVAQAPFINNTLVAGGTSLTNMYALTHPSQPNYLQFFSGSNQGVTDNTVPAPGSPFSTPNLGAALLNSGRTFVGYSEDLPSVGSTVTSSGAYARRHNPWVNWQNNAPSGNELPPSVNQPFSAFPSPGNFASLPKVAIVVPNNNNNMHDGPISQGDSWLQTNLGAYAAWATDNNALLVLTFDEDNSASRNRIPTVFYGANVEPGRTLDSTWTLHNLLRTVEDAYGTTHAASAGDVRSVVGAFTSDPTATTVSFQQGVGGYGATTDTYIEQANPDATHGGASDMTLVADGSPLSQGLIRFDDVTGNAPGQVPVGAVILSAKLLLLTGSSANDQSGSNMSLHTLTVPFGNASTWNSLDGGVTVGTEALAGAEFTLLPNQLGDYAIFDVSDSIQSFVNGTATNFGWLINPGGTDGWRFRSSELATIGDRPRLEITYMVVPEPSSLALGVLGAVAVACWLRRNRH